MYNLHSTYMYIYSLYWQPQQVELVEGYGVYLTKWQLDEAVDQSCNSASRLMRTLLMVFFTPPVLASSRCLGTRKFPAPNEDITGACFSKYCVKTNQDILHVRAHRCMCYAQIYMYTFICRICAIKTSQCNEELSGRCCQ